MTHAPPLFTVPAQGPDTDERYTPLWLVESLGTFDLDPCSPIDGPLHGQASRWFSKQDDGLSQPWHGRVFLNPPFSNAAPWVDRFLQHANGIALLPVSNSRWRTKAMRQAELMWMPDDIKFIGVTHSQQRISMPIFVMAIGGGNAAKLHGLANSGKQSGVLLQTL